MSAAFPNLPKAVSVYEVGPRDGLQNEDVVVSVEDRVKLVKALAEAGLRRIETASFVAPKWVAQMVGAEEVLAGSRTQLGTNVTLSALCPNAKGLDRALAAGCTEIGVFISASESHNRKNVNKTIAETLKAFDDVIEPARAAGLRVRGYVSTLWGCPYEGKVDVERGFDIAQTLLGRGCYEISLGDTIGVGNPLQTSRIVERFLKEITSDKLALHMHDTRGTALANALTGIRLGIATIDASIAGMGGCPYAPGAAGNLATEDLVYALDGMGIDTGIDLDKLAKAGALAEKLVGRRLPGKMHQAGTFKTIPFEH